MSRLIAANQLLLIGSDPETARRVRVLEASPLKDTVWLLDCIEPSAMPFRMGLKHLKQQLAQGDVMVAAEDPYLAWPMREDDVAARFIAKRDANWSVIEPLISAGQEALFHKEHRHRLLRARADSVGMTRQTLYALLRRYWRGGQTKHAVLPSWDRCGGLGKPKTSATVRLGRPRYGRERGESAPYDADQLKELVATTIAFRKQNLTSVAAYKRAALKIYGIPYVTGTGDEKRILPENADHIPSPEVVAYHIKRAISPQQLLEARKSRREFNQIHRPRTGTVANTVLSCGSRYQIDATEWPMLVRSSIDRCVTIGRATLYFVVDHYSQAIVGFHLSLRPENAEDAALAFVNAFCPKDEYLSSIGLDPFMGQWPMHGVCAEDTADRGTGFTSKALERRLKPLETTHTHAPPYRPDLKPAVESAFGIAQARIAERKRDAQTSRVRDPAHDDDGVFTLRELERYIATLIIEINQTGEVSAVPRNYRCASNRKPKRQELWEYGVEHLGGPDVMDPAVIRAALWPRGKLGWTQTGLHLHGSNLEYSPVDATSSISMVRSRHRDARVFTCAFDPSDMSVVYLVAEGRFTEVLHLARRSERFSKLSFGEVLAMEHQAKLNHHEATNSLRHERSKFAAERDALRDAALKDADSIVAQPYHEHSSMLRKLERDAPRLLTHLVQEERATSEVSALVPPPTDPTAATAARRRAAISFQFGKAQKDQGK